MSEVVAVAGETEADFDTRDSHLVSALMAVGIKPVDAEPVRVITPEHLHGKSYQFYLQPVSECGSYRTRDLLKAWIEGLPWIERNPDHPFAYAMATAMNYRHVIDYVKRRAPQVFIHSGKSVALIPLDASDKLQESILGGFK